MVGWIVESRRYSTPELAKATFPSDELRATLRYCDRVEYTTGDKVFNGVAGLVGGAAVGAIGGLVMGAVGSIVGTFLFLSTTGPTLGAALGVAALGAVVGVPLAIAAGQDLRGVPVHVEGTLKCRHGEPVGFEPELRRVPRGVLRQAAAGAAVGGVLAVSSFVPLAGPLAAPLLGGAIGDALAEGTPCLGGALGMGLGAGVSAGTIYALNTPLGMGCGLAASAGLLVTAGAVLGPIVLGAVERREERSLHLIDEAHQAFAAERRARMAQLLAPAGPADLQQEAETVSINGVCLRRHD